jgi:hypothetical protein
VTNAERNPFSPLYVHHAAFISPFNLRVVGGKSTDALRKISKSRRRSAAPKYPLAFLQRADLKKLSKSCYGLPRLLLPYRLFINLIFSLSVTQKDKTTSMPQLLRGALQVSKAKCLLGFMRYSEAG